VWGEFGTLGLRGWAGGDGGCQCCQFGVRLADIDFGIQINTGFSFKRVIFARLKEGDLGLWGGFGTFGLRGWAGGDGGCQCWEFGPDWPISILGIKL